LLVAVHAVVDEWEIVQGARVDRPKLTSPGRLLCKIIFRRLWVVGLRRKVRPR